MISILQHSLNTECTLYLLKVHPVAGDYLRPVENLITWPGKERKNIQ